VDFSIDSLFEHTKVLSLASHHAFTGLAYVTSQPMAGDDAYRSSLWFTPSPVTSAPRLLASIGGVGSPQLSADGRSIAFLSKRGGARKRLPHVLATDGGEARTAGNAKELNVSSLLQWHPDGRHLLALVRAPYAEDSHDDVAHPARPKIITHVPYKLDGSGFTVGARAHLFCLDMEGSEPPHPLTSGDFDVRSGAWSPDGTCLAFTATASGRTRHRVNLWFVGPDGQRQQITDRFSTVSGLCWSPDGRQLGFAANPVDGDSASYLYCWSHADGVQGPLIADSLEGAQIVWRPDGQALACVISRRGLFQVAVIDVAERSHYLLPSDDSQVSLLSACGDALVLVVSSYTCLEEVHLGGWGRHSSQRKVTALNAELSARLPVTCVRRTFQVPDGRGGTEPVDAWLLAPKANQGDPPPPLLVDLHGGPHSIALMDFAAHVYLYAAVARGWMVLAPNPVGSNGYGPEFEKRLVGRWGEVDLPQLHAMVAELQAEGTAGSPVACSGKSYGGFLSAWAIGRSTTFAGAVISAPIANMLSHAGTSDSGYYVTPYAMGAEAEENPKRYQALSPVASIGNASGPVLLLNGADDQRCPAGQCEELMTRIARSGRVPATLVIYPGGSHSLASTGRPSHRCDYHRRIADFLDSLR
jgi:dipeptidyl aminopeptidase/acylaminoacyl peptidase